MSKRYELPSRHIHLDFHTSPFIPNVGSDFDAEKFASTLENAHVNSINLFGRCHHGMLYYDSKKFPERVHPNLVNKNMLNEMIDACHDKGIKACVYLTIQWDKFTAEEHPEWLIVDENGKRGQPLFVPGFYDQLCVNTGYRDFLKEEITELFELMDMDGLWLDIVYPTDCCCVTCRKKMTDTGINVHIKSERMKYALDMIDEFKEDLSAHIRKYNPDAAIFYNTSHIGVQQRRVKDAYSHFELESLPSGNWGYIDFPVTMRYARTLGLDCLSHTGKFHIEWGDLHSYKNQHAIEYECFRMLALGSKCLIGDQLDPSGKLCEYAYDMIGKVYEKVEALDPWCSYTTPVTDFAVLTAEEFSGGTRAHLPAANCGAENMFDQLGYQFDFIDSYADIGKYPLLILPDDIPMDDTLKGKIDAYIDNGGKVIATYESGMSHDKSEYVFDKAGVKMLEPTRKLDGTLARGTLKNSNDYVDYIVPSGILSKDLPEIDHVMYIKGLEVEAEEGTEVLSYFNKPYFDRTYEHYHSHRQTPSSGERGNPGVTRRGNVIYFASPIFTIYNARAPKWCMLLMRNAIDSMLGGRVISHNGPSTMFIGVNDQKDEDRRIVHLLHYIPESRCEEILTIDDVIPIYDLELEVKVEKEPQSVKIVPEEKSLDFKYADGKVKFKVDKVDGYSVVCIE